MAAFRAGFLAGGGPEALVDHFLDQVLPCESAGARGRENIDWTPGNAGYRSAAQFHPVSWRRVERELGRQLAFEDPEHVGLATATWVRLIGEHNIATTGGWPVCGRR